MEGTWTRQFWLDEDLDKSHFVKEFEARFPGGEAAEQSGVEDVDPEGSTHFILHVPLERKRELNPFLKEYTESHSALAEGRPTGRYPFSLFP